jgi:hypothetical protein
MHLQSAPQSSITIVHQCHPSRIARQVGVFVIQGIKIHSSALSITDPSLTPITVGAGIPSPITAIYYCHLCTVGAASRVFVTKPFSIYSSAQSLPSIIASAGISIAIIHQGQPLLPSSYS